MTSRRERERLLRLNEDPGKKAERLARRREAEKLQRDTETPEERRERIRKRKEREESRKKRQDPEDEQSRIEMRRLNAVMKRAQMTEEQREEQRQRDYIRKLSALASLNDEELEALRNHRRKISADWRHNLDEDKKRRYHASLYKSQKKIYQKIKQDPVKYRKFKDKTNEYQRRLWNSYSDERKLKRKTGFRINQKKKRLREQFLREGLSEELIQQRLSQVEDEMWREVFPNGKPPPLPKGRKKVPLPQEAKPLPKDIYSYNPFAEYNFWCMTCKPWPRKDGSYRIVGFKRKSELLLHVKALHQKRYWPCDHCNLLKYSKRALDVHLQLCREVNK